MTSYIIRRILLMFPTLLLITFISFSILDLQPGDYLTKYRMNPRIDQATLDRFANNMGLNKPFLMRYLTWLGNAFTGNLGYSFEYRMPVTKLILKRIPITLLVTIPTLFFVWIVAIPIGVFSATHQYSIGDHIFTFLGFIGLSIPNFFFALVLMFLLVIFTNLPVGGIFSPEYMGTPWSWGKFVDYLWHLWPACLVIGTASMAGMIRILRSQILDELGKQYVTTARSKGIKERVIFWKHVFRNSINPLITSFGMTLPRLLGGSLIAAIVLGLPNVERLFWAGLQRQDTYLTMSILTIFAFVLLIGNLLADLGLAWCDPRIQYQ